MQAALWLCPARIAINIFMAAGSSARMRDATNRRRGTGTFGVIGLALALGACSSVSSLLDTSGADTPAASSPAAPPKPGLLSGIGAPASPTAATAELKPDDYACPEVTVRAGAGTLLLGSKSQVGEVNAMELRYQGSLVRFARDCTPHGGVMSMKVGIEGRVITGPAGGPGTVDVPLRIAVVHEGINPKTIASKFGRESVVVNEAVDRVTFTHVESDISFPLPTPLGDIERYVVYVGFDPLGDKPVKKPPVRKPAAKPKSVAKPKQS
jgi:hypothetical protein